MQDTSLHSTSSAILNQSGLTVAQLFNEAARFDARGANARFAEMPVDVALSEATGFIEDACGALLFLADQCTDPVRQRNLRLQGIALMHTAGAAGHAAALARADADQAHRDSN